MTDSRMYEHLHRENSADETLYLAPQTAVASLRGIQKQFAMLLLALNVALQGRQLPGSPRHISIESHEHKAVEAAVKHLRTKPLVGEGATASASGIADITLADSRALTILPPSIDNSEIALQTIDAVGGAGGTSLVVVPSLLVLDDVVSEFKKKKASDRWPILIMASQCCDDTLQRTAKADECAEFIREAAQKMRPSLIVSTYQSLPKVQQAAQSIGAHIEVSIFLDAHVMAGVSKKTLGLHDADLAIQKRLFVTSIFEPKRYRNLGPTARSIDNTSLFGDVVYHGTLSDAVQSQQAVPLQVIVYNGTFSSSKDMKVIVESCNVESFDAELLMAVADAFASNNLSKAISFHHTRAAAKTLQQTADALRKKYGDEAYPQVVLIDGDVGAKRRQDILTQVRQSTAPVLLANAGVLKSSAGFPEVDLVVFATPKYDHANIIKISGMATVPAPGKKSGYVLLPARGYSDDDSQGKFQAIIAVLRSLIADNQQLRMAMENATVAAGKLNTALSWSLFAEHISLIGIDTIQGEVQTALLELVDEWFWYYGSLQTYFEKWGHCMVAEYNPLHGWVNQQRHYHQNQKLSTERILLLEKLGFVWELFPDCTLPNGLRVSGEEMYRQISSYQLKHGHCYIDWSEGQTIRCSWLNSMRSARFSEKERLSDYLVARLDKLGMDWDMSESQRQARRDALETWEKYFKTAESHFQLQGHLVPFPSTEGQNGSEELVGADLYWWLEQQRPLQGRINLPKGPTGPLNSEESVAQRVARFNAIGMQWTKSAVRQNERTLIPMIAKLDKELLKLQEELSQKRRELETIQSESFEQYKKKYTQWRKREESFKQDVESQWSKDKSQRSMAVQKEITLLENSLKQTERKYSQIQEEWHYQALLSQ